MTEGAFLQEMNPGVFLERTTIVLGSVVVRLRADRPMLPEVSRQRHLVVPQEDLLQYTQIE